MMGRDIPLIVSGPMVLALLREIENPGTGKRQTRRLAWTVRDVNDNHVRVPTSWQRVKPGDWLWVRENIGARKATSLLTGKELEGNIWEAFYVADGDDVVNEREFNLLPWWRHAPG